MSGGRDAPARASTGIDRESELLPRDLPPRAARSTASFLLLFVAVLAVASVVFELPETVRCPFVLVPEEGTDPIEAPRRAIVERIEAAEGAEVKAGALLCTLRSEEVRVLASERAVVEREVAAARERMRESEAEALAQEASGRAAAAEIEARVARLRGEDAASRKLEGSIEARHRVLRASAESAAAGADAVVVVERAREAAAREIRERSETAAASGAVSQDSMLRDRFDHEEARRDLEQALRSAAEAHSAIEQLEATETRDADERALAQAKRTGEIAEALAALERARRDAEARSASARERAAALRETIATGQVRAASLARELEGSEGDVISIRAPWDGVVVRLAARRAGAVVERGETLCEMARAGAVLHAELDVPEKEVGRLATGQPVKLLFASYPYPRYGSRAARLTWVSPSAAGASFRAFATAQEMTVVVDGVARPLRAGMGGEARVVTGSRTLVEYVIEPLRELRENLKNPK